MSLDVQSLCKTSLHRKNGVYLTSEQSQFDNQAQTNDAFSTKWTQFSQGEKEEQKRAFEFQKNWYLTLYGFESESHLAEFLQSKSVIFDAGCGLGYKASWFAELAPDSLVVGMDYSDAAYIAAAEYSSMSNLVFIKGDIAETPFKDCAIDYVSCDQVIHHTEDVAATYAELTRILSSSGEFAVYMYAKKSLPRELVDDYFRTAVKDYSHDEIMEMSEQLTELGKRLSELNVEIDVPDIPLLGIKGGNMDVQRFVYWNFLKCFWNEQLGWATSVSTNFDWYSPSNAYRYSLDEFLQFARDNKVNNVFLHSEEACHSGRFKK